MASLVESLGRFTWLLASLLLMLLAVPFLAEEPLGVPRFRVLSTAVLVTGIYAVGRNRRVRPLPLGHGSNGTTLDRPVGVRHRADPTRSR